MNNETAFKRNKFSFSLSQLLGGILLIGTSPLWFPYVFKLISFLFFCKEFHMFLLVLLFLLMLFFFFSTFRKKKYWLSLGNFFALLVIAYLISTISFKGVLIDRSCSTETSAIGSLRSIAIAQSQFQRAGLKDRDSDGVGEFGNLVELSGLALVPSGRKSKKAKPAYISSIFGTTSSSSHGIAARNGYLFRMYLPSGGESAIAETGKAVPLSKVWPPFEGLQEEIDAQEKRFVVYAWPLEAGETGYKAYFINESGILYSTRNIPSGSTTFFYSGLKKMPKANDIFDLSSYFDALDGELLLDSNKTINKLVWNPAN